MQNGYTYFSVTQSQWNTISTVLGDNAWCVNQTFLDQQLALGKMFLATSENATGAYFLEVIYLRFLNGLII